MTKEQEMWNALKERVKGGAAVSKSLMNDPKYTLNDPATIAYKKGMMEAYNEVLEMMFVIEQISTEGDN